jgi:hypothetical protein
MTKVDSWYIAMVALLPFLWDGNPWSPRIRSWLVLMAASLLTFVHQSHGFYIAINIMGAGLILAYPVTQWQRAIGLLFVVMGFLVLGHYLSALQNFSSAERALPVLMQGLYAIGWAQFFVLLGWTGHELFRRYRDTRSRGGGYASHRVEP